MNDSRKSLAFLCIGSATQDVFLSQSRELAPVCENPEECFFKIELGDKINVNKIFFATGGGANNASVTFARGGFKTFFMGTIGQDPAAEEVLNDFSRENIDVSYLSRAEKWHTDYSTLLVAPDGERTIFKYIGCGGHLDPANFDVAKVFREQKVDWIYVTSLAGNWEIYGKIFTAARENQVKIAWNPGKLELKHPEKVREWLQFVEILAVNKKEAMKIMEDLAEFREDFAKIGLGEIAKSLRQFCPIVLVTDGRNGSAVAAGNLLATAGIYGDGVAKDMTGAGDAFASGFTKTLAELNLADSETVEPFSGQSWGKSAENREIDFLDSANTKFEKSNFFAKNDGSDGSGENSREKGEGTLAEKLRESLHFAAANSAAVVQKIGAKTGVLTGRESLAPMEIEVRRLD